MISSDLAYVAVIVRDVEAVAGTLSRDLNLSRTYQAVGGTDRTAPVLLIGKTPLVLFEPGDPFVGGYERTGVHHLGLAVADPLEAAKEVQGAGVASVDNTPQPGLGGAGRILLHPGATAGVMTYLTEPLELGSGTNEFPNGLIEGIDHLGAASADTGGALDAFSRRLGFQLESSQTDLEVRTTIESFTSDKYGVVYHARPPELVAGLRVTFVTIGDCELEFLENFNPEQVGTVTRSQAGDTRQDQGAISRFIESRGPGLHHLALRVTDIEETLSTLKQSGHELIDTVARPGSRRAKIGFIHPASLGGLLVHLVQREEVHDS